MGIDLKLSDDGDLVFTPIIEQEDGSVIGDLALVQGDEAIGQIMDNRIRTQAPEWKLHPDMGGNLTDLIGEPNSRATAEKGEQQIRQTVTFDNLLEDHTLIIKSIPTARDVITFIINAKKPNSTSSGITIVRQFDVNSGINKTEV